MAGSVPETQPETREFERNTACISKKHSAGSAPGGAMNLFFLVFRIIFSESAVNYTKKLLILLHNLLHTCETQVFCRLLARKKQTQALSLLLSTDFTCFGFRDYEISVFVFHFSMCEFRFPMFEFRFRHLSLGFVILSLGFVILSFQISVFEFHLVSLSFANI